ncbi:MAG: DUF4405 domain-containing protein [Chloroflexi bacterium]|nr:DUF4405 domain-containing protein [Chloroflexota bacterium]
MTTKRNVLHAIKWRNLASFFLTTSGIIILVSGVILYIAPPGHYAHAVDWRILGLDKGQWEALHTLFSYAAVLFAIIHIVVNWKILVNYLWDRAKHAYRLKREFIIAILLTLLIGVGTIENWPPFSTVMDWGETLSSAWEANSTGVGEEIIHTHESEVDTSVDTSEGHESMAPVMSRGWGRYTVAEICQQMDVPVEEALNRLAAYNIEADETSRIRTLADVSEYEPSGIVDIILGQPVGTIEGGGEGG